MNSSGLAAAVVFKGSAVFFFLFQRRSRFLLRQEKELKDRKNGMAKQKIFLSKTLSCLRDLTKTSFTEKKMY